MTRPTAKLGWPKEVGNSFPMKPKEEENQQPNVVGNVHFFVDHSHGEVVIIHIPEDQSTVEAAGHHGL